MKLLKTQVLEKKRYLSSEKAIVAHFFYFYRVWRTSENILLGSTSYSDNYFGTYGSTFLGPTGLLKTQISEKRLSFQWKKSCGLYFFVVSNMTNVMEQF